MCHERSFVQIQAMYHVLGSVQIPQTGVYTLSSSAVCAFIMPAAADVLPMIRQWFHPLLAKMST